MFPRSTFSGRCELKKFRIFLKFSNFSAVCISRPKADSGTVLGYAMHEDTGRAAEVKNL